MNKNTKVNSAILIIGNEILSGRTQDTNTSTLATWLNSIGVKVGEVRIIPDIEKIIVTTLNLLKSNYYRKNSFFRNTKLGEVKHSSNLKKNQTRCR